MMKNFDLEYALNDFREIQDQYFNENKKCWLGMHPGNHTVIMEKMLNLIDLLENEVKVLEYEYNNAYEHACQYQKRAKDAEKSLREINRAYEGYDF